MGECEAYYRVIQSMHLKQSSIQTVFAQTGFNPSRYLERIDENDLDKVENVVEVEGREGKYQEKPSLYEKYVRRDCWRQPELSKLCYAQFVKRYTSVSKVPEGFQFTSKMLRKEDCLDENGKMVNENHIVASECEDEDFTFYELPEYISITDPKPGELPYMKRKSAMVLRYHKINKQKQPHEFYYSELQLYHPHSAERSLEREKEDLDVCKETYCTSNLLKVKSKIMEFLESVEEGLERAQELENLIGDELDAQAEQDKDEDSAEGVVDHPDFIHLDPNRLENIPESSSSGVFKTVSLSSKEELYNLTNQLDEDQRLVLAKFINYAKQLKIARTVHSVVKPPLMIVQGGAGAGKSLVIKAISQWFEKILRKDGDDPDKPYILLSAFTGCAAANIDGMTMHSAFNLNFGNEFLSLPDKTRDLKRDFCVNLKAVIIDEAFVLKADDFYKFNLRMQELMNSSEPFGGIAVLLLGDILQLKPVMGRFIFEEPKCPNYHMAFITNPVWQMFEVVLLRHNHRQGEDHQYAEILNRIRTENHTEDDCAVLQQRVFKFGDKNLPSNALYIMCTNEKVKEFNDFCLKEMNGDEVQIEACVQQGRRIIHKPKLGKDGSIDNTPLQHILTLKKGAQVMLTFNVNVVDNLANGALGKVIDLIYDASGKVKTVLVQFKNEKAGKETRKGQHVLLRNYSNELITPISKIEFPFSLAKKTTTKNDCFIATQFPLKLAFACTAHKMQGSTVSKPDQLVIDLTKVFEAAQAYVMMSRVQSLTQLYILDKLPLDKIYASKIAMKELKRLENIALNDQVKQREKNTSIISLNVRSLVKNHRNLIKDYIVTSDIPVLALQETWLDIDEYLEIQGYQAHFVNQGHGKGVVTYFKDNFKVTGTIKADTYQISKISSETLDVVNVYRNWNENTSQDSFLKDLQNLTSGQRLCYVVGDFNVDILKSHTHQICSMLKDNGFEQIISSSTHEGGGLIDHVYVKNITGGKLPVVSLSFPFYTDHAAIAISI